MWASYRLVLTQRSQRQRTTTYNKMPGRGRHRYSSASSTSSTSSYSSMMGGGFPRTRFEKCELLQVLLLEFDIDTHLIDSRYASADRPSYARYKCPVCEHDWGSAYGWFTIDIKAPAVRRWGQACKLCWNAERKLYLSEAKLNEDRLETLLIKAIHSIVEKYHRPLKSSLMEGRFLEICNYEEEMAKVRAKRAELKKNGLEDDTSESQSERPRPLDHDVGLCERCKFGKSPFCLPKRFNNT